MKQPYIKWNNLTIQIPYGNYNNYEIDLESCTTASELCDWLFQIYDKPWMTPELFMKVMSLFNEACNERFGKSVQGCLCSFGENLKVNWKTVK